MKSSCAQVKELSAEIPAHGIAAAPAGQGAGDTWQPSAHPALAPACQVAGRALAPAGPGTRLTWAHCPLHSQCKSKASATAAIHKRAITTSLPHKSTAGKIEFEVESIQRQKVGIFMSKFGVFLINN